ncbi:Glycerol-3-phosphate ABC transporter, permease protein UgpE [Euzebya pacifica]|uniref:Glycerol-3-phosphate ABC transporter, permease protein UgpE n=1 Tax=Euzebya pacifica TaxID=1608957 RepID=A0A346XWM4_9ACTN|nr:carbohydrate ABC transporter permease [Euzebya pacifica]AXV06621.1 Glycerol-3-phosphate ABC transporter, permease protein UgpE [Euzebya pacifica]
MAFFRRTRTAASSAPPASRRRRLGLHAALLGSCIVIGLPVLYAALVSTQTNPEVFQYQLTPGTAFGDNFEAVWEARSLGRYMLNSTIQALAITVGKTITALLAGLAFVYFRFPGKWLVFGFVLVTLLMPTEISILALFRIVNGFGWNDSVLGLTVPFFASATGAFLFRQHFANLPADLSEAAQLDGAGPLQFLWRILIPLSWNAIGALAVIQFVYAWNMYLWPLLIVADQRDQLVQVGLGTLLNTGQSLTYGPLMLGALLASVPPVLVFVALQKPFMSGFAVGGEK